MGKREPTWKVIDMGRNYHFITDLIFPYMG
jgi:hypothetical protein